ncbi:MAG: VCBS repeat-containing protein, partial [Verrucomicrobiaceae bacterium]
MKVPSPSSGGFVSLMLCALSAGLLLARPAQALERLPYNNPALTVDLGVGLWAWPVPHDADGDGDPDLIVVCPDKPSNGTYYFENVSGPGKPPLFKAAKRLGKGQHYATPSYVDGKLRVLTPSAEYPDFLKTGLDAPRKLPLQTKEIHKLSLGTQPGVFKIRHNQWRYVDFDGDGALDLAIAIEDWSHYGWDDAWDQTGQWKNGPLHGIIYILRNTA